MKVFGLFLGLLGMFQALYAQNYVLSGTCQITRSYCGGVAPSQEDYARMIAPKPYIGKVLYLKKGFKNSFKQKTLAQAVCDSNGCFSFTVSPGDYCIVQAEHTRSLQAFIKQCQGSHLLSDVNCLKQWWINGLVSFSVNAHKQIPVLEFHQACFTPGDIPCIGYTGPMPP